MNKNYALITGASQGLGRSFAYEMASRKKNLILVALANEGLVELAQTLIQKFKVDVVYFESNFVEPNAVEELAQSVNEKFEIDVLINNAGLGGTASFSASSVNYIDAIIQVNIRALSLLIRLLLPNLKRQQQAYILNVASMASFTPIPYKTVYPASKAFVYFLSRTLNEELRGTNVFVSVLHPGPMKTNQRVTRHIETQGWIGKMGLIPTDRLARLTIRQLYKRDSLIIPGFLNKINWLIIKMVPIWLQLYLGARITRKELEIENPVVSS